ncbi:ISSfl2 ORF [Shigella sonnei]|nr:ISSfl2 ORF [Shigella sonnei]
MVTLKAHILPHPDLQPPGCRGSGKRLFDKALPNDENKLRSLISDLKQHGQILLVVDQPATIGALPVAVARSEGVLVGYLPGLAMRRIADLHAGEAKTDARDAAIIAEAARTLPHALRTLKLADEQIAELSMLCGFDDDLAAQTTQASNRIRGLLTQIHPALERVLGPRLEHPAVLDLLQRWRGVAFFSTSGSNGRSVSIPSLCHPPVPCIPSTTVGASRQVFSFPYRSTACQA